MYEYSICSKYWDRQPEQTEKTQVPIFRLNMVHTKVYICGK